MPRRATIPAKPWTLPGLGASGPDPSLKDNLALFGQFVGDWDIDRWWVEPDGSEHRNTGRVSFRWILGGRAVQDVWSAIEGDPPVESAVGTTVRFYDAEEDAWTSLWVAPRYGLLMRFAVHETGGEIVLESRDEDGQLDHWIFSDVTPAAFRWRAEESHDDGKTWKRTEEMRIHRRSDEG